MKSFGRRREFASNEIFVGELCSDCLVSSQLPYLRFLWLFIQDTMKHSHRTGQY